MLFGVVVTNTSVVAMGIALFLIILFQSAMGLRWIKFGKHHRVWHRRTAYVIVALGVVHGFAATVYAFGLRVG